MESLVTIINDAAASSGIDILAQCKRAIEIIDSSTTAISAFDTASRELCAGLSQRFVFTKSKQGNADALAHLRAVCVRAIRHKAIEVEGAIMGHMFGSADLVYIVGKPGVDVLVLVDVTSDKNLSVAKKAALKIVSDELKAKFPALSVDTMVQIHTEEIVHMVVHAPSRKPATPVEEFQFDYVDAIAKADIKTDEILAAVVNDALTMSSTKKELRIDCASDICAGMGTARTCAELMTKASPRYPATVDYLRRIYSTTTSLCRGLPPPTAGLTIDPSSWAHAFTRARHEQVAYAWSPGEHARPATRDEGFRSTGMVDDPTGPALVVIPATGALVKISVSSAAPLSIRDMVDRPAKIEDSTWSETSPMTDADACYAHYANETKMSFLYDTNVSDMPSVAERCAAIVSSATHDGTAQTMAAGMAFSTMTMCASTVGFQMVELAREIAKLRLLAAKDNKGNTYTVGESAGGRIVVVAKCTGPLEKLNASSVIVAVATSLNVMTSWVDNYCGTTAQSKCLILKPDDVEWYSAAPGAVASQVAAYCDTTRKGRNEDYAGAAGAVAVANRKPFNIALQMEKYFALSSASLASDFDDLVAKLDVCTPNSDLEKMLLFRMVIRGLAVAVERDTGTLKRVAQKGPDGVVTIRYCSSMSTGGSQSAVGITNAFYNGTLASGEGMSKWRAIGLATLSAYEGTQIYESRKPLWARLGSSAARDEDLGDPSVWGASPSSVRAWMAGTLDEFVLTRSHIDSEIQHGRMLGTAKKKYAISLLAHYSACAAAMAGVVTEGLAYKAATIPLSSIATNKAMHDSMAGVGGRQTDKAFAVVGRSIVSKALPGITQLTSENATLAQLDPRSRRIATLGSELLSATAADFAVYVIDKAGTIEKPRDISLMTEAWRPAQAFQESIGYDIGSQAKNSALKDGSKIKVIQRMEVELGKIGRDEALLYTGTDKSTYGPSKLPAQMYAMRKAAGLTGDIAALTRDFFVGLTCKRMRLSDTLLAADQSAVDRFDAKVGAVVRLARARADMSVPLTVGMMQGLGQGNADASTAASTWAVEKGMEIAGHATIGVTTNDDGAFVSKVKMSRIWQAASDMKAIVKATGYLLGEPPNTSKLSISTVIADLNTQLMSNGRPMLPYVRQLMNCGSITTTPSMRESAMAVLGSTNAAVVEGAPLSVLYVALGVAWASHYERFRVIDTAVTGVYATNDVLLLGPPLFAPTIVYAHGIASTVLAENDRRGVRTIASGAVRLAAAYVAKGALTVVPADWKEGDPPYGTSDVAGCTDYIMSGHPTSKDYADTRYAAVGDISMSRSLGAHASNTVAGNIRAIRGSVESARQASPYRATSVLVASCSSSYAYESQMVTQVSTSIGSAGRTTSTKRMTLPSALACAAESLAMEQVVGSSGEEALISMMCVDACISRAYIAMRELETICAIGVAKFVSRRTVIRAGAQTEGGITDDIVMSVAHSLADADVARCIAYTAMTRGVYIRNCSSRPSDATIGQVDDAIQAARRMLDLVVPRRQQAAIVSEACSNVIDSEIGAAIAMSNIGMGYYLTPVGSIDAGYDPAADFYSSFDLCPAAARKALDDAMMFKTVTPAPASTTCSMYGAHGIPSIMTEEGGAIRIASVGPRTLEKVLNMMAARSAKVVVDATLIKAISSCKRPATMRSGIYGIGIAAHTKLALVGYENKVVDAVVRKVRSYASGKYAHTMQALVANPNAVAKYVRGKMVRRYVAGENNMVTIDMPIEVLGAADGDARVVYALYPPAVCLCVHGELYPIFDAERVSNVASTPDLTYNPACNPDTVPICMKEVPMREMMAATYFCGLIERNESIRLAAASLSASIGPANAFLKVATDLIEDVGSGHAWSGGLTDRMATQDAKAIVAAGMVKKIATIVVAIGGFVARETDSDDFAYVTHAGRDGPTIASLVGGRYEEVASTVEDARDTSLFEEMDVMALMFEDDEAALGDHEELDTGMYIDHADLGIDDGTGLLDVDYADLGIDIDAAAAIGVDIEVHAVTDYISYERPVFNSAVKAAAMDTIACAARANIYAGNDPAAYAMTSSEKYTGTSVPSTAPNGIIAVSFGLAKVSKLKQSYTRMRSLVAMAAKTANAVAANLDIGWGNVTLMASDDSVSEAEIANVLATKAKSVNAYAYVSVLTGAAWDV